MNVFFLPNILPDISLLIFVVTGRDIVFGVANRYGLDGPGVESGRGGGWGRDFLHPSRPAQGPNQPPVQ